MNSVQYLYQTLLSDLYGHIQEVLRATRRTLCLRGSCVILVTALSTSAMATDADNAALYDLLNGGKGIDAQEMLSKRIESLKGNGRVDAIHDLLDVCLLMDDTVCIASKFDRYWEELYAGLDAMPRNTREERELWSAKSDSVAAKYLYRTMLSLDERPIKDSIKWNDQKFIGSPRYEYAAARQAIEARAAALLDKRDLAARFQMRARAFVFSRNINQLATQSALAFLMETNLYTMHDVRDVQRFIDAFRAYGLKSGQNLGEYFNPYAYLRLLLVYYDSGLLDPRTEPKLLEDLHALLQGLQIRVGSKLDLARERFYAYLSLQRLWGRDLKISFDPVLVLYSRPAAGFDAVGIRAYLESIDQAPPGANRGYGLATTLDWLERFIPTAGPSVQRNLLPTAFILRSLRHRKDGNSLAEAENLESFVDAQLRFFSEAGYSVLDHPPALSRSALMVNRYVIQRLIELRPESERLRQFVYFVIQSINAAKDGDKLVSYALLRAVSGGVERDQVINRITLRERYGKKMSEIYLKSLVEMPSKRKNLSHDGSAGLPEFGALTELLNTNSRQLLRLGSVPSPILSVGYQAVQNKLSTGTAAVLVARASDFALTLVISKGSVQPRLVDLHPDGKLESVLTLLHRANDKTIPANDLLRMGSDLRVALFGDSVLNHREINFLSGPTILGVPYTLLGHSALGGTWLIDSVVLRGFSSSEHFLLASSDATTTRELGFVAFANPSLRSISERDTTRATEELIRGAGGNVSSLAELPETEVEVKTLAQSFGGAKRLFLREEANADSLFSLDLDEVEVLTFSTHGVLSGEIEGAESTSIVLSPTRQNSGLVPLDLIFSLDGSPNAVILSTCNSGTSAQSLSNGEIDSLASAFLLKGSRSVVSSYWQVNSAGTVELMKAFSRALNRVGEYGAAMTEAVREIKKNQRYAHPSVWAAFVTTGLYTKGGPSSTQRTEAVKLPGEASVSWSAGIGSSYVQALNIGSGKSAIYKVDADAGSEMRFKKVPNDLRRGESYRFSSNTEFGRYVAAQTLRGDIFGELRSDESISEICTVQHDATWRLADFFVDEGFVFSLYVRRKDGYIGEIALVSQNRQTCEQQTLGPLRAPESKNPALTKYAIYPGSEKNRVVVTSTWVDDEQGRSFPGNSELGYERQCRFAVRNEYAVLDETLRVISEHPWAGLNFLESPEARGRGVLALEADPCLGSSRARVIHTDWFNSPDLLEGRDVVRPVQTQDEVLVSNSFSSLTNWISVDGGDLVYVVGTPGIRSILFQQLSTAGLTAETRQRITNGEYGIYVGSRRSERWKKITDARRCSVPAPLTFEGQPSLMCQGWRSDSPGGGIEVFRVKDFGGNNKGE
jgi:hypothetical protein